MYGASILAPAKSGGHIELYILLISEILDHDAQIANMLLNRVLDLVRRHPAVNWSTVRTAWLVSDCGPHFRSYESMAHYQYTLVKALQMKIHVLYLGEQHGKGACDRLFGWTNDWLQQYIQAAPVHGIQDLLKAFKDGSSTMMKKDPKGPLFVIEIFEPGKIRPSTRLSFTCTNLKISRTYSLSAELSRHAPLGVTVRNNVFSDLVAKESLGPWSITETIAASDEEWRRGYYDKVRTWEDIGPQPGDVTELTRKFAAQKGFQAAVMPNPKRSIEEKLSAKAQALSKQARKRKRQTDARKPSAKSSSSSSSSGSTSSSDESASSAS